MKLISGKIAGRTPLKVVLLYTGYASVGKSFFSRLHQTAGISLKKFCTYDISSGILSREDVNGL